MTESVLDQLRRRAYDEAGPLPPVELRPADAVGHVLREDVVARGDLPADETVTVDGWAVAGPGPWHVVPSSIAATGVPDGSAVAVAAGDLLPAGTTSAVAHDEGDVDDGRLHAVTTLGENLRARGSEVASGALLIPDGTLLTPGAVALAAAGGNADVLVTGRPTVAMLVPYGAGADSVGAATLEALLPPLIRAAGALDVASRRVPDTSAGLRSSLDSVSADVVVVSGSVGDDRAHHLDAVLADARADVVVDGARDASWVAGARGWLLARMRDGRVVVALPGDVRGAVAATLTLARPVVRGLSGYEHDDAVVRELEVDVEGGGRSSRFVFVRGMRPTPDRGPATGRGMAAADALVLVPPTGAPTGTPLPALPLLP